MTQTRTRLSVDERRAQLLKLGKDLFGDKTYDDLSIDEIARAVGISKGLLYHYFPSKREFYVETIRAAAEELMVLTTPAEDVASGDRLRVSLTGYINYVDENALAYATLLRSGVGADAEVSRIVEASRLAFVNRLLTGLQLDEPDPALRATLRGWVGFVEGASLDWIDHRDFDRDTLLNLLVTALTAVVAAAHAPRG